MSTRRPTPEHQAAISRRLALLGDELSGVRSARPEPSREGPSADLEPPGPAWWDDHTRVAASHRPPPRPSTAQPPRAAAAVAPRVPLPGRHASRRSGPTVRGLALAPVHLAVVTAVVALGLAVTGWWLVRGDAGPAETVQAAPAPGLVSVAAAPVIASARAPAADSAPATVTIDVAGKVRRPGIAVLDQGARVVDALAAAGGAKAGVDLTGLNLARVLVDGEQVVVGAPQPSGAAAAASSQPGPAATAGGGPATLVNLNTAGESELDLLPEVGPVTAASILAWRDEHGGFTSVDELLEVDGIGEATLGRIAPFVTV